MKTRIALVLAALMALLMCTLAACAKNETKEPDSEGLKAYMDANAKKELWKRHQIFRIDFNEYRGEEIAESLNYYLDDDYALWDFSYGVQWLDGHDFTVDSDLDGETPYYTCYLADTQAYYEEMLDWAKANEFLDLTEIDRVLETVDDGKGTFAGLIEFSDPEKVKQIIEDNAPDLPDDLEYEEGMAIRYKYTFSTETNDLLRYDTFLVKAGEEPILLNVATFSYDGEPRDPFAEGEPFADYRAAMEDPTRLRKVTVVFDPDTADERVLEYDVPHYAAFRIFSKSECVQKIYTDRACTHLYEGNRGVEDLTLYAPTPDKTSE